jgi:hypothetical protein
MVTWPQKMFEILLFLTSLGVKIPNMMIAQIFNENSIAQDATVYNLIIQILLVDGDLYHEFIFNTIHFSSTTLKVESKFISHYFISYINNIYGYI